MNYLERLQKWWEGVDASDRALFGYKRLWVFLVVSISFVSIVPLFILFFSNYYQYQKAFREEVKNPIRLLTTNVKRTIQFYLEERTAALNYIINDQNYKELLKQKELTRILNNLKQHYTGFIDIGLIDQNGVQRSYVGPYDLEGKTYKDQNWFKHVLLEGGYVSEVFMGYREYPHFAIAVKNENTKGETYVLRATLNAEIFIKLGQLDEKFVTRDAFIMNKDGVLQTSSKNHGEILSRVDLELPLGEKEQQLIERENNDGRWVILGYSLIPGSTFVYVVIEQRELLFTSWFSLRNKLVWLLIASVLSILVVALTSATYMMKKMRKADLRRVMLLHKIEYTSKMASIGRLAAGVAHEINNPLAIINEKAGLLKDFTIYTDDIPQKEKFLKHIEPIISSVERCGRITKRLLGFAKHMDIKLEPINLEDLIREVLGFLEKESNYRNISFVFNIHKDVPLIKSDKGRLQQVFLNIINNAFGAMDDGGRIEFIVQKEGEEQVCVKIKDNGVGISQDNLDHIFEPFFTTKREKGTGLGLSITYGIIEKLGGKIFVESMEKEWTEFSIVLPLVAKITGDDNGKNENIAY